MDGTELCCRFSLMPNKLGFCGPKDSTNLLLNCALGRKVDKGKVKEILKRFESLYPYLELIGRKHNLDPFDYKVVEAYWLGNELLDGFTREDMVELVNDLAGRGLIRSLADKLIDTMPDYAIPFHLFHVLFVGVGSVTKSVENNIETMDKCRISLANVKRIMTNKVFLSWRELQREDGELILVYVENDDNSKSFDYDSRLTPLKPNDDVAVHWNYPVKILNYDELCNLRRYTHKVLRTINSLK